MDTGRMIRTKFWSDDFIGELSPLEKLLYLYLLTNERTNICGAYEVTLRIISFDTGIDQNKVKTILEKFEKSGKILFVKNYIFIKNFAKHQNKKSPTIQKAIENNLALLPQEVQEAIQAYIRYGYGMDTVSVNRIGKESEIEIEIESEGERERSVASACADTPQSPSQEAKEFFDSEKKQQDFVQNLILRGVDEAIASQEVRKFVSYWTERNKSGTKQKWQLQNTFELARRLAKWFENSQKWAQGGARNEQKTIFEYDPLIHGT